MPSTTWTILKAQIGRRLNDESHAKYGAALLLDLVNDALIHFASVHTGLASDFTLTGDGSTYVFDLPSSLVDTEHAGVYAVQWTEQEWLREVPYWHGMRFPSSDRDTSSSPKGYTLWPYGKISFGRVPGSGDSIILHCVVHYPTVTVDGSYILVPFWAREAIKCYVCAEALGPGSVKAAQLRQYQSRREAGRPEDNPLLKRADRFALRYYQILSEHRVPQYKQDVSTEVYR